MTAESIRPLPGYPGYTVSRAGVVYSKSGAPLTPHDNRKGYLRVRVYADGAKHWVNIHQAVARAFHPNPDNLPCINHKDENRKNNNADNLEWCTQAYNLGYGTKPLKTAAANQRNKGHKVIRCEGGKETFYPSINHASIITGIGRSVITKQCKTTGEWRYAV